MISFTLCLEHFLVTHNNGARIAEMLIELGNIAFSSFASKFDILIWLENIIIDQYIASDASLIYHKIILEQLLDMDFE